MSSQRTGLTALVQVDCAADFHYLTGTHAALTAPLLPACRPKPGCYGQPLKKTGGHDGRAPSEPGTALHSDQGTTKATRRVQCLAQTKRSAALPRRGHSIVIFDVVTMSRYSAACGLMKALNSVPPIGATVMPASASFWRSSGWASVSFRALS